MVSTNGKDVRFIIVKTEAGESIKAVMLPVNGGRMLHLWTLDDVEQPSTELLGG